MQYLKNNIFENIKINIFEKNQYISVWYREIYHYIIVLCALIFVNKILKIDYISNLSFSCLIFPLILYFLNKVF